ncbi:hypothetical protein [Bacillus subtilis]
MFDELGDDIGFASYTAWLNTLTELDESTWEKPIANDKWSIKAIVLHIAHWDNHLLNVIIPAVKNGEGMIFPEFDSCRVHRHRLVTK